MGKSNGPVTRRFLNCVAYMASGVGLFLPGIAIGQPAKMIFTSDGKKIEVYKRPVKHELIFYDGVDDNAPINARVDLRGLQYVVSRGGKHIALCSQYFGVAGPARIYSNTGDKVAEFHLPAPWFVNGVSDNGQLFSLGTSGNGPTPLVVRLCNRTGNVLLEYKTDPTRVKFTEDSIPVVWGRAKRTRRAFFAVHDTFFNAQGGHEYKEDVWIRDVGFARDAKTVFLLVEPKSESFTGRIDVWRKEDRSIRSLRVDKSLGAIQSGTLQSSPSGRYLTFKLGGSGIAIIDATDLRVLVQKRIVEAAKTNRQLFEIKNISNNADVVVRKFLEGGGYELYRININGEISREQNEVP